MLPYVELPEIPVLPSHVLGASVPAVPVTVKPFGAIVLVAIAVGVVLSMRQAKRQRLARSELVGFLYYVLIGGFLGGHIVELVFYEPESLLADPMSLFDIARGQSSFGGFLGAVLGALAFKWVRARPILGLVGAVASSFPAAWVIGRIACAVVHDHPGIASQSWLAVAYPSGARFDLGLLEAVAVIPLAAAVGAYRKRGGTVPEIYVAAMCLYYAPLRFGLDFLRVADGLSPDRRYGGATPAQWGCFLLIGIGLYFSARARQAMGRPRSDILPN